MSPPKRTQDHRYRDDSRSNTPRNQGSDHLRYTTTSRDSERTSTPRSNQSRAYDHLRHTTVPSSSRNDSERTPSPYYETMMNHLNLRTPASPPGDWERELENMRQQDIHPNPIDSYLYQGQNDERPGQTSAPPPENWVQSPQDLGRHEVPPSNMQSWREKSYSPLSSWGDSERTPSPSYDRNLMTPAPPSENWEQELEDMQLQDIHPNLIDSYHNPNDERPGLTPASPSGNWGHPPQDLRWHEGNPNSIDSYHNPNDERPGLTPASPSGNWEQPPQDLRWHEVNPNSIDSYPYQNPNDERPGLTPSSLPQEDERLNITPSQLPQAPSRRVIQPFTRPDDISVEKWETLTKASTSGRRAKGKKKFEEWKNQNQPDYLHYREYTNLYLSRSEAGQRSVENKTQQKRENNAKRLSYATQYEKIPREDLKAYASLQAYVNTINERRGGRNDPINDTKELQENIETYYARQREALEQGQMLSSAATAGVFAVPDDFNVTSLQGLAPPPQSMGENYWTQQSTTSEQVLGDSLTAPIDLTAPSSQDSERQRKRRKSVSNSNPLWSSNEQAEMTRFEMRVEKEPKEPSRVSTKDQNRTVSKFLGKWPQKKPWM